MNEYIHMTLKEYLEKLSDKKIVPGGGSASALVSALGCGLNLMVINFCLQRKNVDDDQIRELEALRQKQRIYQDRISRLIDEDCIVFTELMDILSNKSEAQEAYKAAASVPLKICRESANSAAISLQIAEKAGKHLISDVGCAANFLETGFMSAKMNVEVNLKYIKDKDFVLKSEEEVKKFCDEIVKAASGIKAKMSA